MKKFVRRIMQDDPEHLRMLPARFPESTPRTNERGREKTVQKPFMQGVRAWEQQSCPLPPQGGKRQQRARDAIKKRLRFLEAKGAPSEPRERRTAAQCAKKNEKLRCRCTATPSSCDILQPQLSPGSQHPGPQNLKPCLQPAASQRGGGVAAA
jgi:hypothetical protein